MGLMKTDRKINETLAIGIVRRSSKGQEGNTSAATQEDRIRSYCSDKNYCVVKLFSFIESAKDSEKRKKYKETLEFALNEGIKNIVFYRENRETRNLTDNEYNENLAKSGIVAIHYAESGKVFDKNTATSEWFTRDVMAAQAKQENRERTQKTLDGMQKKAEMGWYPSNRPPLGYRTQRELDEFGRERAKGFSYTIIDPIQENVDVVKMEFELRAAGLFLDGIREQVIKAGMVPERMKEGYTRSAIEARLKNIFYEGKFIWNGVVYEGKHPLFIAPDILRRVRNSFENRVSKRAPIEGALSNFMGLLKQ